MDSGAHSDPFLNSSNSCRCGTIGAVRWHLPLLLAVAALAAPLQTTQSNQDKSQSSDKSDKKNQPPPPQKSEPAPLFGGQIGVRSSQKTKESASLGFNGIDPSGKVDQKMLATTPTAADQDKVKKMSANQPSAADLKGFLKQGGLNTK